MKFFMRRTIITVACITVLLFGTLGTNIVSPTQTAHATGIGCPHLLLDDSHNPWRVYISDCWIGKITVAVGGATTLAAAVKLIKPELQKLLPNYPILDFLLLFGATALAVLQYRNMKCSHHGVWLVLGLTKIFSSDEKLICSPVPPVSNANTLEFYDNFMHRFSGNPNYNKWTEPGIYNNDQSAACTFFTNLDGQKVYTAVLQKKSASNSYVNVNCTRHEKFANGGNGMAFDIQYYTRYLDYDRFVPNVDVEYSMGIFQKNNPLFYLFTFSFLTGKYRFETCTVTVCYPLAQDTSTALISSKGELRDIAVRMQDKTFNVYSADDGPKSSAQYTQPFHVEDWQRIVTVYDSSSQDTGDTGIALLPAVSGQHTYLQLAFTSVRVWQLT